MAANSGQILLLNGVSSSGKSTIIHEIHKINPDIKILKVDDWFPEILQKKAASFGWQAGSDAGPWLYICNHAHRTTGQYYFDTQIREMFFEGAAIEFYQKAKDIAKNQQNVIIDTVLENDREHKTFDDFFKIDKALKVLIYCPMNVLLERVETRNRLEIAREYRNAFQSFEQFPALYKLQEAKSETIVDIVEADVLEAALEKAIQELIKHNIPDPYLPKLSQFKIDFIKKFRLSEKKEVLLVAKHTYDLILNNFKETPVESAKTILKLLNS